MTTATATVRPTQRSVEPAAPAHTTAPPPPAQPPAAAAPPPGWLRPPQSAPGAAAPTPGASTPTAPRNHLQLWYRGGDGSTQPLDAALLAQFNPHYRDLVRRIVSDPAVRAMAARVAKAEGRPARVVIAPGEMTGFSRGQDLTVLGQDALREAPTRMIRILVHELAHDLQDTLYGEWLPQHDYGGGGIYHWLDKPLDRSTAWVEGFADAVTTHCHGDPHLGAFEHRHRVYYEYTRPRASEATQRTEGFVASVLVDYWGTGDARFDETLEVLALQSTPARSEQRHSTLDAFVAEYTARHPDSRLRWHLAYQTSTLLARGLSAPLEAQTAWHDMNAHLSRLSAAHGPEVVGRALHHLLMSGQPIVDPTGVPAAVEAQIARLRGPTFRNALNDARDFASMSREALTDALRRAEYEKMTRQQISGISLHAAIREVDEHIAYLQGLLRNRR